MEACREEVTPGSFLNKCAAPVLFDSASAASKTAPAVQVGFSKGQRASSR